MGRNRVHFGNSWFDSLMEDLPTVVSRDRCFMLFQLCRQAMSMPGNVAEVGVYKGGTAKIMVEICRAFETHKVVHLFDTFSGMPAPGKLDPLHKEGDFGDAGYGDVGKLLGGDETDYLPFIGEFPETARWVRGQFCFVHVDCDLYESTKAACEVFYNRMTPGGVMLFDDYGFLSCAGAKKAVDEFFAPLLEYPILLPTGQAVVIRDVLGRKSEQRLGISTMKQKPFICVRRKGGKGDLLMLTPALRALRKKYPTGYICVESKNTEVLETNPHIDHQSRDYFEQRKVGEFDLVFQPRREDAPSKNAIGVFAEQCEVKLDNRKMELPVPESGRAFAKRKLDAGRKHIAFHTGVSWPSRQWSLERFAEVAKYFVEKGYLILELGGVDTERLGVGKDCRGIPFGHTAGIIEVSAAFVGIDSGPANMAKAIGTPACVIYGCVDPATRKADAVEYPVWIADLACKSCASRTTAGMVECTRDKVYCLEMITPNMVIAVVERMLRDHVDVKSV